MLGRFRAQRQEKRKQIGRHKQREGHGGGRGVSCQRSPVQREQFIQVHRVDGHIAVARNGVGIQVPKPHNGVLPAGEHATREQKEHQRASQAHERTQTRLIIPRAHQRGDDENQTQRRKKQRLRLGEHRQGKHGQRHRIAAAHQGNRGNGQHQRKHAIHLAPGRAIQNGDGIEGVQACQHQRDALARALLGVGIQIGRARQIEQNGHQLDHQPVGVAIVGDAKGRAQRFHGPEQQEIHRRIIAKIVGIGIKFQRPGMQHAVRPGLKAIDVHRVAAHRQRDRAAQNEREQHRHGQYPPRAARAKFAVRAAELLRVNRAQQKDEQHGGEQDQFVVRFIARRRFFLKKGIALPPIVIVRGRKGRKAHGLRIRRRAVQFHHPHIVKPRAHAAFRAIKAHAQQNHHFRLVRPRLTRQREVHPFAIRFARRVGFGKGIVYGNVGAFARNIVRLGLHPASNLIIRAGFHGHRLAKARVVEIQVVNLGRAILAGKMGDARIRKIGIGIPPHRQPVFHLGKVPVDDQVILFRRRNRKKGQKQQSGQQTKQSLAHTLSPSH